jgi:uncharacterized protein (DUF736 family)
MQNNNNNRPKLQVGSFWTRTSKAGNQYTSGLLKRESLMELLSKTQDAEIKVMLFSNRKTNEKQPDFKLMSSDVDFVKKENHNFSPEPPQSIFDSEDSIPF